MGTCQDAQALASTRDRMNGVPETRADRFGRAGALVQATDLEVQALQQVLIKQA